MNPSKQEVERRYKKLREVMIEQDIDALVVCGNQYAGFEGGLRYVSGFEIVHRYAYLLFPLDGEPTLLFPKESRWIGDKKKPWVQQQVWCEIPGRWLRDEIQQHRWKRSGIVGLDFIMAVRDYRELDGRVDLVPFDFHFDLARAVKSEEELTEVHDSMDIIQQGFWALVAAYAPGRTEAEIMAPAIKVFFARGAGSRMMNMVLSGANGEAEAAFKLPAHRVVSGDDLVLCSLEITGSEGYWVEFSRPLIRGRLSHRTERMKEAYPEALHAAQGLMREGELASTVHRTVANTFARYGFSLGHLSGHSIGQTMLEHPFIGATSEVVLKDGMIVSLHPQVVDQDGKVCLYTQDTYRVGKTEAENLCNISWKLFDGSESPSSSAT